MGSTDLGIIYPDSDDNTELWVHFQTLAESVNDAIDLSDSGGLVTAWTDMSLTPDTGWTVNTARYRIFLGALVVVDLVFTRTGADIVAGATGNLVDTPVAHGFPSGIRPASTRYLDFMRGSVANGRVSLTAAGAMELVTASNGATINSSIQVHDLYVLG